MYAEPAPRARTDAPTAATCPNICRGVNPNEFSIFVIGDADEDAGSGSRCAAVIAF